MLLLLLLVQQRPSAPPSKMTIPPLLHFVRESLPLPLVHPRPSIAATEHHHPKRPFLLPLSHCEGAAAFRAGVAPAAAAPVVQQRPFATP